jgi:hypothetical protein
MRWPSAPQASTRCCRCWLSNMAALPPRGDILVTGANGGVGSIATLLLSSLGYRVVASTGRLEEAEYLRKLGAAEVIDRRTLSEPGKPLARERWAGAVDSVGSHTLANVFGPDAISRGCDGMRPRPGCRSACNGSSSHHPRRYACRRRFRERAPGSPTRSLVTSGSRSRS